MSKTKKSGTGISLIAFLIVWGASLAYSHWYLSTGWDGPNAIMNYCSQFNDTSLGWFDYIFRHGVLNFVAGYGAIFPLAVPIVALIQLVRKKSVKQGIAIIVKLFFTVLVYLVLIAGLLYGSLYLMEQMPLLAGLLLIIGVGCLIPTGKTIYVLVIVD